jgi:uncharacterized protein DUF4340
MRGVRSFLVLVAILIGLGAYWYFVESKRTPGEDTDKKEKVFAGLEADKIEEIALKSESGEKTTLKKAGNDWQIVAPVAAQPDAAEVSGLTSNLSSVEIQRVVEENAPELKEFGLAQPRVQVTYKAAGQQHTLNIGEKTPAGSDLYATRDAEKKVFLIPAFLDSTFNRTTFDLREKAALKVDRDKVDVLEVTTDKPLRFAKVDNEWRLTAPVAARADFTAVEGIVGRVAGAQMKSIAAPEAADPKQYGFDKPAATVKIGTGSSQATLIIGKTEKEGAVYARDLSRPAVFTLESAILDELKKPAGDFRQKDLFDARTFNATRVEVTRAGQTAAFEKAKVKGKDGKEEEKWRQVAPAQRDIDSAKLEALLTAATSARADTYTDDAKVMARPEATIAIKYDDGKKEDRVTFARSGSDAYAQRAAEPGAAKIAAATLDSIVKALDDIK